MASTLHLGRLLGDEAPLELKADTLVTHGVVFGMTGSGKTGLAITLLEELVLAGVPVIALDPKGDLPNLGLVFPDLAPESFEPWAAAREGENSLEAANRVAQQWKQGLAEWKLGPDRMAALKNRMALSLYTPGSTCGVPVNVLGAFACPGEAVLADSAALQDLVSGTVSGLLALVGVEADPIRDPSHIVLSQVLDQAWKAGDSLDLAGLITHLVDPPFKKVGVFPLDTFYPPDQRMKLAMSLNGVLASPSFASWMSGESLDLSRMTDTSSGKTPVSLFYLAHLSDAERMFFVSLLLDRVVAWSRTLPGASGLRALVYFDEVAGYLPPHPKDPPSKKPIMTLMKQARAVGLGTVLATQNPVDVDYKAMSNAGTWLVGRLQTAQDRDRVSEGLTSAAGGLDRAALTACFDQLKPRVFMVKEAGKDKPALFETRWAMSYLRGPVTRSELERLTAPAAATPQEPRETPVEDGTRSQPPPVPQDFCSLYLDPAAVFSARLEGAFDAYAEPRRADGKLRYRPALYAELQLRFDETQGGFELDEHHHRVFFPLDKGMPARSVQLALENGDLLTVPHPEGVFEPLPDFLDEEREFKQAQEGLMTELYRNVTRGQWVNSKLKLYGTAGETREDFEERCRQAVRDKVDQAVSKLRDRYDAKVKRIEERVARQREKIERLEGTAQGRRAEQLLHAGEMIMGLFTKRHRSLSAALTKHRMSSEAKLRAEHAAQELGELEEQLVELQDELAREVEAIEDKELAAAEAVEERPVRLEKNDVRIVKYGVLWIPVSRRI